jgi:hypothetical protein
MTRQEPLRKVREETPKAKALILSTASKSPLKRLSLLMTACELADKGPFHSAIVANGLYEALVEQGLMEQDVVTQKVALEDLRKQGLRLASSREPGWYVRYSTKEGIESFWVTDSA